MSSAGMAGGAGACEGIGAEVVTDWRVSTLGSDSSGNVIGSRGCRIARDCSISGLSSAGTGQTIDCNTTLSGIISSGITGILVTGIKNVGDGN